MKGHRGEAAKQSQMKGALGPGERGPLFPRLHVNETEKAGPKAPPRNKMALYEQFTVPSHCFVQPSQTSATTVYQQQYGSHELGYPYLPYYMPSVAYANTSHRVQVYAQPSYGTSSSGVTYGSGVVNEELLRKFPRHHKMSKSSPCKVSRGSTEASTDCITRGSSEWKGKDANAPAQSSITNPIEESTNSIDDVSPATERPTIMEITESLEKALSTVEVGLECVLPDGQSCSYPIVKCFGDSKKSTCMADEGQLQKAAQHSAYQTLTKQTKDGALVKSSGQSCLQIGSASAKCKHDSVTQGLTTYANCTTLSIEPKISEESLTTIPEDQSFLSSASWAITGPGSALTGDETFKTYRHKNALKNSITDVDDGIGVLSDATLAKPDNENFEERKNIQNRNSEAQQRLECGIRKGGRSDDLVVPSASFDSVPIIKPKNVIHAIGQQQFWKARKTLLRQQQIFSDQVFQLHKLIKIQQLLAETPGTLTDEEMHFETLEECNVAAPLAKVAGEDAHKAGFDFRDTLLETGGQSKNKQEQHTQAVGKDDIGSSKLRPEFRSGGGVSAWGYPSLGQWVGPMAAQGQPFGYQPFPGTFPPGSAFGLPYGSALQGSVSPMISFGIPYCDRRQELPAAEMGSNYGPPTVFKHEGSGTVSGNSSHVSNNVGGSWCNNLNQQGMHTAPSGKDVPSGSGASVNKSPIQVVNTSRVPGSSYQWGLTNKSSPSNTDSLKSNDHQSESLSPSFATRLKCHKSSSTPSTFEAKKLGLSHQDVGGLAQTSDLGSAYGSFSSDQYDISKGSGEKGKLDTSLLRCSKSQKDGVCLPTDGRVSDANEHSSDINHSALELFPLVPFLSSSGQNSNKAAEEGQGQVIRAVPRRAVAASESAAGILLSLQRERQK